MKEASLVIGQAGTGKTTWLIQEAKKKVPNLISSEYQSVLAITRMHGARRKMEMKLRESLPGVKHAVTTIDGFALSMLNRWRTALGYSRPICAVNNSLEFKESIWGVEADFQRILEAATRLLEFNSVKRIIAESFPLIMIDEFQDCHGSLLNFVKAVASTSSLLLAADHFQLLDTSVEGCPSLEWAEERKTSGILTITELTQCHRTSMNSILSAAKCLRNNIRSTVVTVPVYTCPNQGPAAWKLVEKLALGNRWTGSTALICPSNDPFIRKVLSSWDKQIQKHKCHQLQWHVECSIEEEEKQIRKDLGLGKSSSNWTRPLSGLDPIGVHIAASAQRFARLKGMTKIPQTLVERHVEKTIHDKRAYRPHSSLKTVTTVHGAKNREFANVFILWTYKLPSDLLQQRRLLYNAVTRAMNNCMVLVLGDENRVLNDPILNLLGPSQPVFHKAR